MEHNFIYYGPYLCKEKFNSTSFQNYRIYGTISYKTFNEKRNEMKT